MHNATALGGREKGKIPIVETGLPFPLPLGSKLLNVDAALSINNPLYNNRQRSKSKDVILKFYLKLWNNSGWKLMYNREHSPPPQKKKKKKKKKAYQPKTLILAV